MSASTTVVSHPHLPSPQNLLVSQLLHQGVVDLIRQPLTGPLVSLIPVLSRAEGKVLTSGTRPLRLMRQHDSDACLNDRKTCAGRRNIGQD